MCKSKFHVLVVDDAPNWRNYLQAFLESIGWQVYTAENLEQGMDALKQRHYDLAIVDVRLTEGDPQDVSGLSIVKDAWLKHVVTRFIILSGFLVETRVRSELTETPYHIYDKADITNPPFEDTIRKITDEAKADDFR